jgi:hypothetical protein
MSTPRSRRVDTAFQEMSGKAMAQGMDRHLLVQAGGLGGEAAGELQRSRGQRPFGVEAGEQPLLWPFDAPVSPQDGEQLLRQHDIAILAAFALADVDHHPRAVDIGDLQVGHLGDPQAGGVHRRESRVVLDVVDRGEKAGDFFGCRHDGQDIGAAGQRNFRFGLRPSQRDAVEEAQPANDLVDGLRLGAPRNQVQLIGPHIFEGQHVR